MTNMRQLHGTGQLLLVRVCVCVCVCVRARACRGEGCIWSSGTGGTETVEPRACILGDTWGETIALSSPRPCDWSLH